MTTKVQRSINLLTKAPHNTFAVIPLRIIDRCYPEQEPGFHKLQYSMERVVELRNIESLKKTILTHEDTFKQQVQELHRLYNLQKKLMNDQLYNRTTRRKEQAADTDSTNSEFIVLHQPAETNTGHMGFQDFNARLDPRKLNSSCSGESSRMPIKFNLEIPAEKGNGIQSSICIHPFEEPTDLKRIDEETDVEVELTLSIGHCKRDDKTWKSDHLSQCSTHLQDFGESGHAGERFSSSIKIQNGDECINPSLRISSSSSSLYQDNTQPCWLLQDLSLKRT